MLPSVGHSFRLKEQHEAVEDGRWCVFGGFLSTFVEYSCYLSLLPVDISHLSGPFVCDFELAGVMSIGSLLSRKI